ncbi:29d6bc0f-2a66-4312-bc02-5c27108df120 [Thermothielavioides terrestris]|uniref:29d6bc0f-2a66-4312-bc02-5c27108df120 n=1 Tax=Thermothielavioides terrestris TaxID=2587410 RepID=A0A446BL67_9PEZI|nr:29d6bc0f-2a66-4312-bc02-5c27108df120 [Thermothielavioides terrestris]
MPLSGHACMGGTTVSCHLASTHHGGDGCVSFKPAVRGSSNVCYYLEFTSGDKWLLKIHAYALGHVYMQLRRLEFPATGRLVQGPDGVRVGQRIPTVDVDIQALESVGPFEVRQYAEGWVDHRLDQGPFVFDHGDLQIFNLNLDDQMNIVSVYGGKTDLPERVKTFMQADPARRAIAKQKALDLVSYKAVLEALGANRGDLAP